MYIVFEAAGVFLNKTTGRFDHGGYGRDKEAELVARAKVSIGGISTRSGHPPSMAQSRRSRSFGVIDETIAGNLMWMITLARVSFWPLSRSPPN
jgi:hypothetical protein